VNVIVSNKYKTMFDSLNIEIIKNINGEFEVDEIIDNFKNFFFQRMILDITALKNYKDIKTIQRLSVSLDMEKIILVLDASDTSNATTSPNFISQLISIGIYNFTTNLEGIMYLYNSPNTYRDVAHLHIIDIPTVVAPPVQNTVYVDRFVESQPLVSRNRILGIKNVTRQSGATTLTYMIKKELQDKYSVAAIEVEKSDFKFLNDRELVSTTNSELASVMSKYSDKEVILIDINNSANAENLCDEIIYLVEPSIIKLNRLMLVSPKMLNEIKNKKIVLNQSLLNSKDVSEFEYESKLNVFFNIPPLDERTKHNEKMIEFLNKLGFNK